MCIVGKSVFIHGLGQFNMNYMLYVTQDLLLGHNGDVF